MFALWLAVCAASGAPWEAPLADGRAIEAARGVRFELGASAGVTFGEVTVTRGEARCAATVRARHLEGDTLVVARRCGLTERWSPVPGGVEHTLVLERAPRGQGEVRVRLAIDAPWERSDARGHVFGGVRYGNAFVVRGAEQRPLRVERVTTGLELVVPPDELHFPLHIDPLVSAEVPLLPSGQLARLDFSAEDQPAIAWSPLSGGQALVVWVDRRRGEPDLFGALLDEAGTLKKTFSLVKGPAEQRSPVVAWEPGLERFVLAWEEADAGVGLSTVDLDGGRGAIHRFDGAAPTLSMARGDAGVVLGLVRGDVPTLLALDGGVLTTFAALTGVARTAVAWAGSEYAMAVGYSAAGVDRVKVLGANSLDDLGANPSLLWDGASLFVAWEGVAGVRVVSHSTASTTLVLGPVGGSGPTLFEDELGRVTLGYLTLLRKAALVRIGGTPVPNELTGALPGELRFAATSTGTLMTWSSEVLSADVWAWKFGLATSPTSPISLATVQAAPKVSLLADGTGWAGWRSGATAMEGRHVVARGTQLQLGSDFALTGFGSRVAGFDLASGPGGGLLALTLASGPALRAFRLDEVLGAVAVPVGATVTGVVAAPAVDWDGERFFVAVSGTAALSLFEVGDAGVAPASQWPLAGAADLDLACRASLCALAWSEATAVPQAPRVFKVALLKSPFSSAAVPELPATGQPALSFVGAQLCVAWPAAGGVQLGCSDDGGTAFVDAGFIAAADVEHLALARTEPLTVAWSGAAGAFVARPGEPPRQLLTVAQGADFSGWADSSGSGGVLVARRFDDDDGQRVYAVAVAWPFDAGTEDAGTEDGGTEDGGTEDGGTDDGGTSDGGVDARDGGVDAGLPDGGPASFSFHTSGCTTSPAAPLIIAVAVLLRRLRRR